MIFKSKPFDLKMPISFYIKKSSYIHIALLLFLILWVSLDKIYNKKMRTSNLKLLESSIQVDMVAMPTHTMQELKKISFKDRVTSKIKKEDVKKEKVKDIINKDDVVLKKVKSKKSFMDMLKDINKKGSKKKKVSKGNSKKGKSSRELKEYRRLVLMGNQLSKGNSAVGKESTEDVEIFNAYAQNLLNQLRPYWTLPGYLLDLKLRCRIQIFLLQSGKLVRASVFESSGNTEYDQRALETVKKASPYPVLPKEIIKNGINGDLILGFPL